MAYISRNYSESNESFGASAEVLTNPTVYIKALGVLGVSLMFYYGALSMSKLDQKVLANSHILPDVPARTIEVQKPQNNPIENVGKILAEKEAPAPKEITAQPVNPAKGSIENIVETFKPRQNVGKKALENTKVAEPAAETPTSDTVEVKPEAKPTDNAPQTMAQPEQPVKVESPVEPVKKPEMKIPDNELEAASKSFIYKVESGNNPNAVNPRSGACGLGQALPCEKLTKHCNLGDYKCQDEWFENYMKNRYGSWQAAENHWRAAVPINGQPVGHWW